GADGHRPLAGRCGDAQHVAARTPHAHQRVEPIELLEDRVERRERRRLVRGPRREPQLRPHRHAASLDQLWRWAACRSEKDVREQKARLHHRVPCVHGHGSTCRPRWTIASALHSPAMRILPPVLYGLITISAAFAPAQQQTPTPSAEPPLDPIKTMVERLDLEKHKATVKSLTQFRDRRQGTDSNRAAHDWIEAQLKGYGCPTDRIKYEYDPPPNQGGRGRGRGNTTTAQGGGRFRGIRTPTGVNTDPMKQPDEKL